MTSAVRALQKHTELQLGLVGDHGRIITLIRDLPGQPSSRIKVIHNDWRISGGFAPSMRMVVPLHIWQSILLNRAKLIQWSMQATLGSADGQPPPTENA